ncbi:RNA-directed DNA polymerase, eukaryota [Tanacetum coccineum]|uniref:RNA-directed DNA polymerase, eukaryota n=1 Tax=Tanacetum coccineum TaxID=301880 RepID=A0ABQ4Z7R8_9ASTR
MTKTVWIPSFKKVEPKIIIEEVNKPHSEKSDETKSEESEGEEDGEYVEDTFNNGQEGGAENECHQQGQETNSEKEKVVDSNGDGGKGESKSDHKQGKKTNSNHKKGSEQMNNSSSSGWGFKGPKPDKPSTSFRSENNSKQAGFSILDILEKAIEYGKSLRINIEGCVDDMEKIINGFRGIQETKMTRMDLFSVKAIWGNSRFDFACSLARGLSGGILCVWNPDLFVKTSMVSHDHFVVVEGIWKHGNVRMQFIMVYSPQDANVKALLWYRLHSLLIRFNGCSIIMGDFNVVRVREERFGSEFNSSMAEDFNDFITENELVDLPLGGYKFTWVNRYATKMSKIDRILISDEMTERFPDLTATILDKGIPDHRPILVKEATIDYGPPPFRFFHSWIECKGFEEIVIQSWNQPCVDGDNHIILLKNKLKRLKNAIKIWSSDRRKKDHEEKHQLATNIKDIDLKADQGVASADDILARQGFLLKMGDIKKKEAADLLQKARVNWCTDGDENSKFFHGLINQKRRQVAIRGKLLANRIAMVAGDLISEVQSGFVRGRQIMDGPLILNEIINWRKNKKEKTLVFKVDFEKVYDSLCWDFLQEVMHKMGFGSKWSMEGLHMLIENVMNVSRIKGIEIDGSGIVLSHLFYADDVIFIGEWSEENVSNIVMLLQCFYLVSGLKINLSKCSLLGIGVQEAEVKGVADGVGCTAGTLPYTYLEVPIGNKMSKVNDLKDLIDKFKNRLSNWKIKTLSVGGRVTLLKSVLGSIAIYLMSIFKTPITMLNDIESIRNKFFLGAEMDERKLTWIQWRKTMASKKHGRLGIGSLYGFNRALLFKWKWRFLNSPLAL